MRYLLRMPFYSLQLQQPFLHDVLASFTVAATTSVMAQSVELEDPDAADSVIKL